MFKNTGGKVHEDTAVSTEAAPKRLPGLETLSLLVLVSLYFYYQHEPARNQPVQHNVPTDFLVYYLAGDTLNAHQDLYTKNYLDQLPFTYPPFAGLVFRILAAVQLQQAALTWMVLSTIALLAVICAVFKERGYGLSTGIFALSLGLTFGSLALEPIRSCFYFGQINVFLMALIALDLLRKDSKVTGLWTGIASGLKLTPLYFLLVFLVQRKWAAMAIAVGTFITTVLVGVILVPDGMNFWTGKMTETSRIGEQDNPGALSIRAILHRCFGIDNVFVWFVLSILVTAAVALGIYYASKHDNRSLMMSLGGIGSVLVSPFSWQHHWLWILPLLMCIYFSVSTTVHRLLGQSWLGGQAAALVGGLSVVLLALPYTAIDYSYKLSHYGQAHSSFPWSAAYIIWGVGLIGIYAYLGLQEVLRSRRISLQ